jgi:hypothetical protein
VDLPGGRRLDGVVAVRRHLHLAAREREHTAGVTLVGPPFDEEVLAVADDGGVDVHDVACVVVGWVHLGWSSPRPRKAAVVGCDGLPPGSHGVRDRLAAAHSLASCS